MKTAWRNLAIVTLATWLAACGGSSSNSGNAASPNAIVQISDTQALAGDSILLDGSQSEAASGAIESYQWALIGKPDDSNAGILNDTDAQATLTPDIPGTYSVALTVTDASGTSRDTAQSRATITVTTDRPIARLPDTVEWIKGIVQLDGSRTIPASGQSVDTLQYQWSIEQQPEGSNATLDDNTSIYPRFTANVLGIYQLQLVVSQNGMASHPETIDVIIVEGNAAPLAAITQGSELHVTLGDTVTLDGLASTDANNDPLAYYWRIVTLPAGSGSTLSDANAQSITFTADTASRSYFDYVVELTVFDGTALSSNTARINIFVDLPEDHVNRPPVAILQSSTRSNELERGERITLRGGSSYDVDGDSLTYALAFEEHPAGYNPDNDSSLDFSAQYGSAYFTPSVDGTYRIKLTVSDGTETAETVETFTARLGANRAPSAVAGVVGNNSRALVGSTLTLDGDQSTDPDNNELFYQWSLLQKPAGSTTALSGANTSRPTLLLDRAGQYLVSLQVTDEHGASSEIRIGTQSEIKLMAKSFNNPPITRLDLSPHHSAKQPFVITGIKVSDGGGVLEHAYDVRQDRFALLANSYDQDGDVLTHLWTLSSAEPANNIMEINSASCNNGVGWVPAYEAKEAYIERVQGYREWTCKDISLSPTEPGTYVFQYQVFDGDVFTGPYTLVVPVVREADYPSLLLTITSAINDRPTQQTFPLANNAVTPRINNGSVITDGFYSTSFYNLTAHGGDYTLTDIQRLSDDAGYTPVLINAANSAVINDGFVLAQGESIQLQWHIPASFTITSNSERNTARQTMNDANIKASFSIAEEPGWSVSFEPTF